MKNKDILVLKTSEMMALLKVNKYKLSRAVQGIMAKSKKRKPFFVTVAEFSEYTGIAEQEIILTLQRLTDSKIEQDKKKFKKYGHFWAFSVNRVGPDVHSHMIGSYFRA